MVKKSKSVHAVQQRALKELKELFEYNNGCIMCSQSRILASIESPPPTDSIRTGRPLVYTHPCCVMKEGMGESLGIGLTHSRKRSGERKKERKKGAAFAPRANGEGIIRKAFKISGE